MNASVKLIESVLPASVAVRSTVPATHPSAQVLGTQRLGSGTLVDSSGLVLTVNYVVVGAEEIEVSLIDDTTLIGEVVARDFTSGLAAIKIPGSGYPSVPWQPSTEVQLGQEVFILAAGEKSQRRLNTGAISAIGPYDAYWEYHLDRTLLTTAMNPGLGGGALFASSGRLIGVVALDLREIGRFTLAVPSECFFEHRDELLRHGHRVTEPPRAWIGLFCYDLQEHVVVAGVLPSSPSEGAGLEAGDVILAIDGEEVGNRAALYRQLWSHRPGETVILQVYRENGVRDIPVRTANGEEFFK